MKLTGTAPPGRLTGSIAVVKRNLRVWRKYWISSFIGNLSEPLLYLLALGYGLGSLITEIAGMSYIEFIAPGLIVSAAMYGSTFEGTYGTFTRMVPQHTFEGMLATPLDVSEVVTGEVLFATFKALASGTAVLLVITLFGLITKPTAFFVPLLVVVCGFWFSSMAVLVSGLSPSYDFFNYYFTLIVTPMFLFSGIFFPLEQLPHWAQSAAWFSPLTHATSASRAIIWGNMGKALWLDIAWLTATAPVVLFSSIWIIKRRLVQ